jgi:hypothetical protein
MMNLPTDLPITSPYASIDDAIQSLVSLEQIFRYALDAIMLPVGGV